MYSAIGQAEFQQKWQTEQLQVLDVRELDEFSSGHLPAAQSIPLSQLGERWTELSPETTYYVICHSGGRSAQACQFLNQKGYHVTNVIGGISSWRGAIEVSGT